jgi:hypothetical protein
MPGLVSACAGRTTASISGFVHFEGSRLAMVPPLTTPIACSKRRRAIPWGCSSCPCGSSLSAAIPVSHRRTLS